MHKIWMAGGGGSGNGSDDCSGTKKELLEGYSAITKDSDDEVGNGAMPNLTNRSSLYHVSGNTTKVILGDSAYISKNTDNVTRAEIRYYGDAGYVTENTLFAIDQAKMAAAGGLTAAKMLSGQSAFGIAGSVNVQSILSFSAAPYSSNQITFTWKNPAKGAFSGVIIVGKTGSYPSSISDGTRYYKGSGNNNSANGTSSATVSGFASGTTYYFRAFSYATKNNAEWVHGTTYTGTAATTKGQQIFTGSTTWTVPAGVRSVQVFLVGGGGGGGGGLGRTWGGGGGAGGRTALVNLSVTPGQSLAVTIGAGGNCGFGVSGQVPSGKLAGKTGGTTSFGSSSVSGGGGGSVYNYGGGAGGSGGGAGGDRVMDESCSGGNGGTNGGLGSVNSAGGGGESGAGQGTSTIAPTGTLYSGGGGGGSVFRSSNGRGGAGGNGGGANGGDRFRDGFNAPLNTGGGGGGGGTNDSSSYAGMTGGFGGSGICIIRWGY